MKKLYDRDELWFAVGWIVVYVLGFSNADNLSEAMGMPKLLTSLVGLILSLLLFAFIRKWGLMQHFGLCPKEGKAHRYLYFIPLLFLSSVNFWNGLAMNVPLTEAVWYSISMCFVGFLEEVIFRGLLFKGMCKGNINTAIIVSSLTFGVGHIVNLVLGEPVLDTMLQLVYASAIGFCYTAFFLASGSILPCIISHAFINSTSVFAAEPSAQFRIVTAVLVTVVGFAYGCWLLKVARKENTHGI